MLLGSESDSVALCVLTALSIHPMRTEADYSIALVSASRLVPVKVWATGKLNGLVLGRLCPEWLVVPGPGAARLPLNDCW